MDGHEMKDMLEHFMSDCIPLKGFKSPRDIPPEVFELLPEEVQRQLLEHLIREALEKNQTDGWSE